MVSALIALDALLSTVFAQGIAFATNSYYVGGTPVNVVAADINGDGKLDLITANNGSSMMVLTNNGSGGFVSNGAYTVGFDPACVIAADINGDGRPALITANYGISSGAAQRHTLTVLTNNGNGGFGFNATLNVGLNPWCVIAGDVNGDGKLDLATANSLANSENTLSVLTNNGSGGFGSDATLAVGIEPRSVVAADLNGDGKPDLISANQLDGTLTVLTNDGSGNFGSNVAIAVGSGPQCVTAADVNGDGKPDLISGNAGNGTLTVLLNATVLPGPALNIASTGNGISLYWPSSATNFILESATNLSAPQLGCRHQWHAHFRRFHFDKPVTWRIFPAPSFLTKQIFTPPAD